MYAGPPEVVLLFALLKFMEMCANTERLVLYQNIARGYFIVVAVPKDEFWG